MDGRPARAGEFLQQFAHQMVGGAGARRGHIQVSGGFLGQGDKILKGLGGQFGIDLQNHGRQRHTADGFEILAPFIGLALENERAEKQGPIGRHEEDIAVRLRARDKLARDHPAGPGFVFHHERLAEGFFQARGNDARGHVHIAAGRVRDDDAHRLSGPALGLGRCGA